MLIIFISLNQITQPYSSPSFQDLLNHMWLRRGLSHSSVFWTNFKCFRKCGTFGGGEKLYLQSTLDINDTLTAQVHGHSLVSSAPQGFLANLLSGNASLASQDHSPWPSPDGRATSLPLVICPMIHHLQGVNLNVSKNWNTFFSEEWPVFAFLSIFIFLKEKKKYKCTLFSECLATFAFGQPTQKS